MELHALQKDLYEQSMKLIEEIELLEELGKDATEQQGKLIEIVKKMTHLESVLNAIFNDDEKLDI